MTETLDIDTPEGARKYIEIAKDTLLPGRPIDHVQIGGRWIKLAFMTDAEAVKIARSLYLDIEIPASKGAKKQ